MTLDLVLFLQGVSKNIEEPPIVIQTLECHLRILNARFNSNFIKPTNTREQKPIHTHTPPLLPSFPQSYEWQPPTRSGTARIMRMNQSRSPRRTSTHRVEKKLIQSKTKNQFINRGQHSHRKTVLEKRTRSENSQGLVTPQYQRGKKKKRMTAHWRKEDLLNTPTVPEHVRSVPEEKHEVEKLTAWSALSVQTTLERVLTRREGFRSVNQIHTVAPPATRPLHRGIATIQSSTQIWNPKST